MVSTGAGLRGSEFKTVGWIGGCFAGEAGGFRSGWHTIR